ncbi:MAG: TlyA family RNA methyltransferase [Dissulfurispiraceae bacterium]|jgi:23S rRNA (cytidine1920-2'-O)/16S rRNA (cytidine1409-2'-O)-methyltransferase|nr:TlyA family RNA methyltransferase [Dissulfurispiraceae bacterium]
MKDRLDKIMVARGLAESRERASALIMEGKVLVNSMPAAKAGMMINDDAVVELKSQDIPYVSRGGLKLEKALDEFSINVESKTAMDVGASTGGFTDCLLQRGASKVYAIDVGYGQMDWKLRNDPRVILIERTNIRHIEDAAVPEQVDIAVIDVSFISLSKVMLRIMDFLKPEAEIVALVKPQFEVGKGEVGKGGIVRDNAKRLAALEGVKEFCIGLGLEYAGSTESPIAGQKGNREFLLYLRQSLN